MKGIILAGGSGTRLYPLTKAISKQLMPVYDKPMIYYPLSILMLAGIKEVLIISTPEDLPRFKKLLGDGTSIGMEFKYLIQPYPGGLAQAFTLGKDFISDDDVCLILGDNIFFGHRIVELLSSAKENVFEKKMATVFGYHVKEPKRYGVVEFNSKGKAVSIEEKPQNPKSNYAVTGLYFFDNKVIKYSKKLKPSKRGEIEIADLLNKYRKINKLKAEFIGRGGAWLDTGSISDFYKTSAFVSAIENRQGFKIACLEEIAFNNNWINKKQIKDSISFYGNCLYSNYLKKLI